MTDKARIGALFTDLYELTMAASYFERRLMAPATFTLFVRASTHRNYFVAAGLADVLDMLAAFQFTDSDIDFLQDTELFKQNFLDYLKALRFSGDLVAMPEGTVFFANEPLIEVTASLIEAQLIETFLLNTIGLQSLITTKAARCISAAQGRPLMDFALRRTHGMDAGMKVARSTYIAGFDATSNVLAGKHYGIPIAGTMAHSYIMAFASEKEAFEAYADTFPEQSVFLIDTYDTIEGARQAAAVAQQMKAHGKDLIGVRLDSGDMVTLSRAVRQLLDGAGLPEVKIFASSGFDEYKIADVIANGAAIDAFGVGTKVGVAADAPFLDVVYKMARHKGRNVRKLSTHKVTLAGAKQVFRQIDGDCFRDIIGLREEDPEAGAVPLLEKVMTKGRYEHRHPSLAQIRANCRQNLAALPAKYKVHEKDEPSPVSLSPRLALLQKNIEDH